MFEGAFIKRRFSLNATECGPIRALLNRSGGDLQHLVSRSCDSTDVVMSYALLPASLLALLLSLTALQVLRSRRHRRNAFRFSLAALSACQCLYLLCATMDFANLASGACLYWSQPDKHARVLLAGIVCCLGDSFLSLRNWCYVLITAQRTEALSCPLRGRKLLRPRNFLLGLAAAWIAALLLAATRSLAEVFVVCEDPAAGWTIGHVGLPAPARRRISTTPSVVEADAAPTAGPEGADLDQAYNFLNGRWFTTFEVGAYFLYQTNGPIVLVVFFTIVMVVKMFNNSNDNRLEQVRQQHQPQPQLQQLVQTSRMRSNKLCASRTVLCMALVFSVLHLPSFVGTALQNFYPSFDMTSTFGKAFQGVCEVSLLLDFICTVLVLIAFVPEFKHACSARCCCCCQYRRRQLRHAERQAACRQRARRPSLLADAAV